MPKRLLRPTRHPAVAAYAILATGVVLAVAVGWWVLQEQQDEAAAQRLIIAAQAHRLERFQVQLCRSSIEAREAGAGIGRAVEDVIRSIRPTAQERRDDPDRAAARDVFITRSIQRLEREVVKLDPPEPTRKTCELAGRKPSG